MEDMATLGGRIMAAKQGDDWYSDPKEFRQNYDEIPGEGYRRFQKKSPPEYTGPTPSAPPSVQAAISQPPVDLLGGPVPKGGQPLMKPTYTEPSEEQKQNSRALGDDTQKYYYWQQEGYNPEQASELAKNNAPYVPW